MSEPAPEPAPETGLIVPVEEFARRLGIEAPLSDDDRWLLTQVLLDAQADLEAYLGRPVMPRTFTDTGVERRPGRDPWRWLDNSPVVEVLSVDEEADEYGTPSGLFTVTYIAGLDGAADPELEPLRRYVRGAAMYSPLLQAWFRRTHPELARRITALSVDGQSVTFTDTYSSGGGGQSGGAAGPGGPPALSSCDRWRIAGRRVFQRRNRYPRWPYRDWAYEWPYGGW